VIVVRFPIPDLGLAGKTIDFIQVFQSVIVVWSPLALVGSTLVSEDCCTQWCDWSCQAFCITS